MAVHISTQIVKQTPASSTNTPHVTDKWCELHSIIPLPMTACKHVDQRCAVICITTPSERIRYASVVLMLDKHKAALV